MEKWNNASVLNGSFFCVCWNVNKNIKREEGLWEGGGCTRQESICLAYVVQLPNQIHTNTHTQSKAGGPPGRLLAMLAEYSFISVDSQKKIIGR